MSESRFGFEQLPIEEAVFQALGAASVCWESMTGTGVFQDQEAKAIGDELLERIYLEFGRPSENDTNIQIELSSLLNKYCAESPSGTPDYILAEYLIGVLKVFNEAVSRRSEWRGESTELPALQRLRAEGETN